MYNLRIPVDRKWKGWEVSMRRVSRLVARSMFLVTAVLATASFAGQAPAGRAPSGRLILCGDLSLLAGTGKPNNCILKSRYTIGEPVGFRMTAIDGETAKREKSAQLMVHFTYGSAAGPKTVDVPTRDFQTEGNPERDFFVAKWIVPNDATIGIVRYTVTATDQHGRTAEWKPFPMDTAMLTVVP